MDCTEAKQERTLLFRRIMDRAFCSLKSEPSSSTRASRFILLNPSRGAGIVRGRTLGLRRGMFSGRWPSSYTSRFGPSENITCLGGRAGLLTSDLKQLETCLWLLLSPSIAMLVGDAAKLKVSSALDVTELPGASRAACSHDSNGEFFSRLAHDR